MRQQQTQANCVRSATWYSDHVTQAHLWPPDPQRDSMIAGSIVTRDISRAEFVALIAALMTVDALAIDIMLPALPNMGDALGVANANDRSLVLTAFLLGFGLPQLVFGPLTNRIAFWYGFSGTFLAGGILGFVNTSQPIYVGIYKLGVFFPLAFGGTAVVAAVASSLTPRIIDLLGVHRTAHGAAVISTVTCALWLAFSVAGFMPFWLFIAMVAIFVVMLVASISTTTSLAMQPLGEVAGTASAVFGAMQTVGGAVLGYFVAQAFNGTVVPLVGALLIFDLCILACLLMAEQGRLFAAPGSIPAAI